MNVVQGDACIGDILHEAVSLFEKAGINNGLIDAELLLCYCLNKTRTELYLSSGHQIDSPQHLAFAEMITRRCRREPVAYILGEREFWSQRFIVTPDVLIPRPETEFLVETALQAIQMHGGVDLCLDLCCGSGVIGIILALETGCQVIGTDISSEALSVCKKNSALHGVADNVLVVQSDLASCVSPDNSFNLITANPPYVKCGVIETELEPDVSAYEPRLALDGGEDGLDLIVRIAASIPILLKPGGDFFMEIGHDQGPRVKEIFTAGTNGDCYEMVEILKDYAERDRVVHVRKK